MVRWSYGLFSAISSTGSGDKRYDDSPLRVRDRVMAQEGVMDRHQKGLEMLARRWLDLAQM